MIRIDSDYSELYKEFDRLANIATIRAKGRFDSVLDQLFAISQQNVHVITGHLRGSGTVESRLDGSVWEGEITYGVLGDANWDKDPEMSYAVFERNRGGNHDFFAEVRVVDKELFRLAMLRSLEGR